MQKLKAKIDKDKAQLLRDVEDANANADAEGRQKQEFEKQAKLAEMQYSELQTKADEQVNQIFLNRLLIILKFGLRRYYKSSSNFYESKTKLIKGFNYGIIENYLKNDI